MNGHTVSRLRRSAGAEVLLGIAVLAVTALLVNAQPARSALAPNLFSTEIKAGTPPMLIDVTVDPAKTGPNTIHIYTLTPAGASLPIRNIQATLSLPAQGINELIVVFHRGGANHFLTSGFTIAPPGKWQLTIHVLRGQLNDTAATTNVTIH